MKAEDLYRIPFISDAQMSPDGRRVAFVVTQADKGADENRSRIWVVGTDGDAEPRTLTAGPADSQPRWSPDGRWLAFVATRSDHDAPQLWVLPSDGGEARRLTALGGGAGRPSWSPDGRRLALVSRSSPTDGQGVEGQEGGGPPPHEPYVIRRQGWKADGVGWLRRLPHLFVVDADGGEPRKLTGRDSVVTSIAWSPDGRSLAFSGSLEPDRDLVPCSHVYLVDASPGTGPPAPSRVTDHGGQAAAPTFTTDGQTIVFAGAAHLEVGHARLFAVPASGGVPRPITTSFDRNVMVGAPAYPGAAPVLSPEGTRVLFCARDRGVTHAYAVPLEGGEPEKLIGRADSSLSGLSLDRAGRTVALVEADPATAGEVAVLDVSGAGSRPRRLTRLTAGATGGLGRVEERMFTAPDGVAVHGWVVRPSAGHPAPGPLLLDVHGGPHNGWSPVFDGIHLYHHMLAAQGWTILMINSRGSDGYGEAFYTALVKDGWGQADTQDFLSAVDALVAEGTADPARVAVCGYSYGGFMTASLTARTDRFAAGVAGGVVVDLASWTGSFDIGEVWAVNELGATVADDLDRLLAQSPIAEVGEVRTPTLVLQGAEDHRCPVGQAEQWFSALRSRGVETELVLYPGGGHLFILNGRPSHRVDYNQRVFDWLTRLVP